MRFFISLGISNTDLHGGSVARDNAFTDSDSSDDWSLTTVSTPGGPNDVTNWNDTDGDGIPDANEMPGSTFVGLPLYDFGARVNTKDIFIYINYMITDDRGIIPQKTALNKIVTAFSNKNIRLHFDIGNMFDQRPGIDPNDYDLSDTEHGVPYTNIISLVSDVRRYKNTYMPINKRQIFHYVLFGNRQIGGAYGLAEINGNDILISLGSIFNSSTSSNVIINYQAGVLMHEIGHNLGLRHGGNEDQNYKPNYYSVMNYLHTLNGLPPAGRPGDRYHYQINHNSVTRSTLSNGPYSSAFKIDYSDGTGLTLNESNLNENQGIGRGLGSIDWNTNGRTNDVNISYNINPDESSHIGIISDYNDWNNLYFTFYRMPQGNQLRLFDTTNVFVYKLFSREQDDRHTWLPPCQFSVR